MKIKKNLVAATAAVLAAGMALAGCGSSNGGSGDVQKTADGKVKITITAKKEKYKTTKKTVTVKVSRQDQVITAPDVTMTAGQNLNLGAKARTVHPIVV